jgi:hypothetical protein
MTLTAHAVIGAAAAHLFPSHPVLAAVVAFASHFAADAIPHWDYRLLSRTIDPKNPLKNDMPFNRLFIADLFRVGNDFILGMAASLLIFSWNAPETAAFTLMGAFLGILPDPLQFAYWKLRWKPLEYLQRFHLFIHAKKHVQSALAGGLIQAGIILFIALWRL